MNGLRVSGEFDCQMILWEDHPVIHAVEAGNVRVLREILDCPDSARFGRERSNYIRNENGQTPLMIALSKNHTYPRDVLSKIVTLLLEEFKLDPNVIDYQGRTALLYALMYEVDTRIIVQLLNHGADVKTLDHDQLSPLMYAAALNRKDIVRFVCPDYRAQITATLRLKFSSYDSNLCQRIAQVEHLEVPYRNEGSPKHFVPYLDSPLTGSPINGIRFRVSPSSPSASSASPLSVATNSIPTNYPREPNVSRRTSLEKDCLSKATPADIFTYPNIMRRISSAVFDTRLTTAATRAIGALQFAQLTQNLCVYLEDVDNLQLDSSPEPRDPVVLLPLGSPGRRVTTAREEDDVLTAIDQEEEECVGREKEPRRVSLAVSAPILIKSRSVEEAINRGGQQSPVDLAFRALPRDLRKNALASGHLIERQGSAPQLMLKRKPRGSPGGGSSDSSGAASPTGSLTRNPTRMQILSPLVQLALSNYQKK